MRYSAKHEGAVGCEEGVFWTGGVVLEFVVAPAVLAFFVDEVLRDWCVGVEGREPVGVVLRDWRTATAGLAGVGNWRRTARLLLLLLSPLRIGITLLRMRSFLSYLGFCFFDKTLDAVLERHLKF